MRRFVLAAVLCLFLSPGARADVRIEQMHVALRDGQVNVRVTVFNPGSTRQPGPVLIDLYIRRDESEQWTRVRTWDDIRMIQPGYRVSRDFFGENNAYLAELAAEGHFEARAVVRVPGGVKDVERIEAYERE
ncbi:MAG: hypothetical protein AB1758_11130 [Candidatus Eremiobacterota bacterium]